MKTIHVSNLRIILLAVGWVVEVAVSMPGFDTKGSPGVRDS